MNLRTLLLSATLVAIAFSAGAAQPKIVAHRGYIGKGAPENTIQSLKDAAELQGVDAVELDLWMTTDHVLYVHHDEKYKYNGVEFTTWQRTSEEVDAIIKENNLPLPKFSAFLDSAKDLITADGKLINLIIEFKSLKVAYQNDWTEEHEQYDEAIKNAILDLLEGREYSEAFKDRITYISFSVDFCKDIAKDSNRTVYVLLDGGTSAKIEDPKAFIKELKENGITGIDVNANITSAGAVDRNPNLINWAHAEDLLVNLWTIDSDDQIKLAIEMGADFITTNQPVSVNQKIQEAYNLATSQSSKDSNVYSDGSFSLNFYNEYTYSVIVPVVDVPSSVVPANLVRTGVVLGDYLYAIQRSFPAFNHNGVETQPSNGAVLIYDINTGNLVKTILPPDGWNVWVSGALDAANHLLVQVDKKPFNGPCSLHPDHGFFILDTKTNEIYGQDKVLPMGISDDKDKVEYRYDVMAPVMKDILTDENVRIITPFANYNSANQNSYNTLGGNPANYPEFWKDAKFDIDQQNADSKASTTAFALEYMPLPLEEYKAFDKDGKVIDGSYMAMYFDHDYTKTFSGYDSNQNAMNGSSIRRYTNNWKFNGGSANSNEAHYFLTPMHSGLTGFNIFELGGKQYIIYPAVDPDQERNKDNRPGDAFAIAEVSFSRWPSFNPNNVGENLTPATTVSRASQMVTQGNLKAIYTGSTTKSYTSSAPTYTVRKHNNTSMEISVFHAGTPVTRAYFVLPNGTTEVDEIASEDVENENAPVEYFNLQGLRVNNPEKGIFIKKQGSKVSKVLL